MCPPTTPTVSPNSIIKNEKQIFRLERLKRLNYGGGTGAEGMSGSQIFICGGLKMKKNGIGNIGRWMD